MRVAASRAKLNTISMHGVCVCVFYQSQVVCFSLVKLNIISIGQIACCSKDTDMMKLFEVLKDLNAYVRLHEVYTDGP
jgi:hypothetical protein